MRSLPGFAVIVGLVVLLLAVFAPPAGRHRAPPEAQLARVAALREVTIPTYEGSGQAMHPDILVDAPVINGWEYRMSFTPYPADSEKYEDASVVVSHDGVRWEVERDVVNPLAPHLAGMRTNSDPDYVYDAASHHCLLFYRAVVEDAPSERIYVLRSHGCRGGWSPPKLLLTGGQFTLISPAVVLRPDGAAPLMWTVDAHGEGCGGRGSRVMLRQWVGEPGAALLDGHWMPPVETDLAVPGHVVWHIDVTWSSELKEYWAVFPAFRPGDGCSQSDLFAAHSLDGVHWSVLERPLVQRGDTTWTSRTLYRSTATWLPGGRMRVWFSAKGGDGRWRTGETTFQLTRPAATQLTEVPSHGSGLLGSPSDGRSRSRLFR